MSNNLSGSRLVAGQTDKEGTVNDAMGRIDAAMTEVTTVDMSGGSVALGTQAAQSAFTFICTGSNSAVTLTLPAIKKQSRITNANTAVLTIAVGATTLALAAGKTLLIFTDGTANGLSAAANAQSLPAGGAQGKILAKASAVDFDTQWIDPPAGGSGGSGGGGSGGGTSSSWPPLAPPAAALFNVDLNDGTPLVIEDDTDAGLLYYISGAAPGGDRIRAKTKAISAAADWEVKCRLRCNAPMVNFWNVGLCFYKAGNNPCHYGYNVSGGSSSIVVNRFGASGVGFVDSPSPGRSTTDIGGTVYLRITYNKAADTLTFYQSTNGKRWVKGWTSTGTNVCGGQPTHLGVCVAPNNGDDNGEVGGCIDYWTTTAFS